MPAVKGVAFLIKANTGTEAAPVWTTVGGQRNGTLKMSMDTVDVTSKDSNGWTERLAGNRDWSIDFDALLIEGDAGLSQLESAYLGQKKVQVQFVTPLGAKYQGDAFLTDFNYEAPYDGEATASGTLTAAGALTKS